MFRYLAVLILIAASCTLPLHAEPLLLDGNGQSLQQAGHYPSLVPLAISAIAVALLVIGIVLYANNRLQREIAQRREIEQELQKQSRGLLESQEIAHVGTWEWNIISGELTWSDEIYRIFGLQPQQFSATYAAFLEHVHPDDRTKVIDAVDHAVQHDTSYAIEHRLVRPDGEIRIVNESGRIYRDEAGKAFRMIGVVHDITALKRVEENLRRERDTAQKYLDIAGVMFLVIDADERISLINRHGLSILGYDDDRQVIGRNWFDSFIPLHNRDSLRNVFHSLLQGNTEHIDHHTNAVINRYGFERWIAWQNTPLRDEHGHIHGVLSSGRDITEQRLIEEKLHLTDKVFEYSSEAILITDHNNHIVTVNRGFTEQTGYELEEVRGKDPKMLSSGRHDRSFYREMWSILNDSGHWAGEVWDRRKDGSVYPKWLSINTVRDADKDQLTHYIAIFADISQRKAAEDRIRHMAHHDALTSLPNRLLLQDRLSQALAKARHDNRQVVVMFIDLDRFKTINDSLGHYLGDMLLQEIARRLSASVRDSDTVARLGGDEFVIVLESMPFAKETQRIAELLIKEVSRPVEVDGRELYVTPSIGISLAPGDGSDVETLMRNADTAMYQAKNQGGCNYQFFAPHMNRAATERLEIEHSLRRALDNNEFELRYQPIIDIIENKIYGAEVLLRWHHHQLGDIAPERFIPVAEETNLILPIGEWVLRTAIRQLAEWNRDGQELIVLCVNLSARQFHQTGLPDRLSDLMEQEGIAPHMLELEITESVLMDNQLETVALMQQFNDMGINLSVDDFGTGYSSLSYLRHLPISKLKIDRSFVRDIPYNSDDATVASAIVSLARALDLKVVAEGVETVEQLDFIRATGCHAVQGFLFSTPLEAAEFIEFQKRFPGTTPALTTSGADSL
jgi:diguanylate cyclase (GGDEF)-like protein/PAS domain S-box-containing protein